jgi:hypothetical protein
LFDLFPKLDVLGLEASLLQRFPYQVAELVGIDGLGDVVECPCLRACTAVSTEA